MSSADKFNEKYDKLEQNLGLKLSQIMVYQSAYDTYIIIIKSSHNGSIQYKYSS